MWFKIVKFLEVLCILFSYQLDLLSIVSSSINPEDINRANEHPLVKSFIEKPLDHKALKIKVFIRPIRVSK